MIANKTYNNCINTLKNLGKQHLQIATTTTGDIYDVDLEKNTLFPLFHVNPVSVTAADTQLTYNFQLFIMDAVGQEVLSETLQICVDIIGMFRHSKWQAAGELDIDDIVYFAEGEYNLEPFTERFDNAVTGWVFSIGIIVQNDFQTCTIPMADNPIGE